MPYIGNVTTDFDVSTANLNDQSVTAIKLSPDVGSNGQVLSVDGSGNLQWGNDANAPEGTAVLSTGESGTAKFLRVDGDGTCSWQVPPNTQLSFSNDVNNRIVTGTGSGLNGEANLTFDGNSLNHVVGANTHGIKSTAAGDHYTTLQFNSNRSAAAEILSIIDFQWDGDKVADILCESGSDTTNKDDGSLKFRTSPSQGSITDRLIIQSDGLKEIKNGRLRITSTFIDFSGNISTPQTGSAIFRPDSDTVAISTNNEERVRVDADGDVGIGTTNPTSPLHILKTSGAAIINLEASANGGEALFKAIGKSSGGDSRTIIFRYDSGADAGRIITAENIPIQIATQNTPRIFVKGDGDVGIANVDPITPLHIKVTAVSSADFGGGNASTAVVRIQDTGNNDGYYHGLEFRSKRSGDVRLLNKDRENNLADLLIMTDNAGTIRESFRVEAEGHCSLADGNLKFASGHGIDFTASGAGGSTTPSSQLLDDYEEGTWTPAIAFGGNANNVSYHSNSGGSFVKVGRMIYIHGRLQLSDKGDSTGVATITNLPFTPADRASGGSSLQGGVFFTYLGNILSGTDNAHPMGDIRESVTIINLKHNNDNGDEVSLNDGDFENTSSLSFDGMYPV